MELRGTLQDFSLEAVLGLIGSGLKTGKLYLALTTAGGSALAVELSFLHGEIIDINGGRCKGLDALCEAAVCPEGTFEFTVLEARDGGHVSTSITMASALEAIHKAQSEAGTLPPGTVALQHGPQKGPQITITPPEFRLLAGMRDGMTVREIIAATTMPTVDAMHTLAGMLHRGLLVPESGKPEPVAGIGTMEYNGILSLVEFSAGKQGCELFRRYFHQDSTPAEWKQVIPEFRADFQRLAGPDKTNQVIAELRGITG